MQTHITSPKTYLAVFAALLVLLALSVFASRIEHGSLNLLVALSIAAMKTALIATIFMGIRYAPSTTRLFALAGLTWLIILLALLMSDYATRPWPEESASAASPSGRLDKSPWILTNDEIPNDE